MMIKFYIAYYFTVKLILMEIDECMVFYIPEVSIRRESLNTWSCTVTISLLTA